MERETAGGGERPHPNQSLIEKITCQEVLDGKWVTGYHITSDWRPYASASSRHATILEAGLQSVNPLPGWSPEAVKVVADTKHHTFLTYVLNAKDNPPVKIPWFARSYLDNKSVFYNELQPYLQEMPDRQFGYHPSHLFQFPHKRPTQVEGIPINEEDLPKIGNIIVSPFPYYDANDLRHVTGDDQWRCMIKILGYSDELRDWLQLYQNEAKEFTDKRQPGRTVVSQRMPSEDDQPGMEIALVMIDDFMKRKKIK